MDSYTDLSASSIRSACEALTTEFLKLFGYAESPYYSYQLQITLITQLTGIHDDAFRLATSLAEQENVKGSEALFNLCRKLIQYALNTHANELEKAKLEAFIRVCPFKKGDKVEVQVGDTWVPGTIYDIPLFHKRLCVNVPALGHILMNSKQEGTVAKCYDFDSPQVRAPRHEPDSFYMRS